MLTNGYSDFRGRRLGSPRFQGDYAGYAGFGESIDLSWLGPLIKATGETVSTVIKVVATDNANRQTQTDAQARAEAQALAQAAQGGQGQGQLGGIDMQTIAVFGGAGLLFIGVIALLTRGNTDEKKR